MPLNFWLAVLLLIILALVFVIYPMLFARRSRPVVQYREQNLATYRARLAELERERDEGALDESGFESLKDELEMRLLRDVESEDTAGEASSGGRAGIVVTTLALVLALPVGAFLLYDSLGASDEVAQFRERQQMMQDGMDASDVDAMVQRLQTRLEADPDNPQGWAMLGRSYMQLERFREAAEAYGELARAIERAGDGNPASALGLRAQALFMANRGEVTAEVDNAISRAREGNPDEVNSLGLLGVEAFRNGDYREALDYWERILEIAPDHPQAESIRRGVAAAYSELGEPVPDDLLEEGGGQSGESGS
ncbi:c-type cytochrome biogenesis protein CcmI [Halovibrio salipaludis]|uniref:C-type cytochrome biogenesis protein CcmI n=1 Tax=Halovibrio salipaludis TaxID=2032626 RepID=A0A2A2F7H1_9GAMM|nr:c-type cytochrome biogenesis protein CcmI [Halovibrio salipaludis]PAU81376.1 c-type cytochrome biogenesis protein CcmI [Halovibrio salipaludis]